MPYGDGDAQRTPGEKMEVDPDLVWAVQNYYPAPLAEPFIRFRSEWNRLVFLETPLTSPDWKTALGVCIECFVASVRFTGLVAAAACARQASQVKGLSLDGLHTYFRELRDNKKFSDGNWWGILRETLRALQEGEDCTSALARKYWQRSGRNTETKTDLQQKVEWAIEVRNALAHDKLAPADYGDRVSRLAPTLDRWYRALSFFETQSLVTPVEYKSGQVELEIRCGDRRNYPRRSFDCAVPLEPGKLYLMEARGAGAILEERPPLPLHPFAILDAARGGDAANVLVMRARTPEGIAFGSMYRPDLEADFLEAIAPFLPSRGGVTEMPADAREIFEKAAGRLRGQSRGFLKRTEDQRIYRRDIQVTRESLDESVAEFLKSGKQVLILSGPSGIGKTCFLCHFAEQILDAEDSSTLILLLGADSLPPTGVSLEQVLCEALEERPPVAEWVQKARAALGKKKRNFPWRLVVIIDGIDKHPSIGEMFRAIDQWAETVAKNIPELKLIASFSPAGLDQVPDLSLERYFSPPREILAADPGDVRLPAVEVKPFSEDESREAYEKYRNPGPTTPYDKLKAGAQRVLAHPLFMRLATEAYSNREMPANPISFQTFQRYCEPYIFGDRGRREFIGNLVDAMLKHRVRELSGRQMMAEPGLREAYLAEHSPFHQLLDNQVLSVHRRPKWAFPASLDEEYVAFSMDRIFQFLLILRVFERYEGGMEEFLETGLPKIVEAARVYPSLRSGLVDLLAEVARNTQPTDAQKRRAFTQLCAVSDGGADAWIRDLLSEVLLALADEAVYGDGESAEERDPFLVVIDLILGSLGERAAPLFSATVTALFVRALWEAAIILLRRQAESPDLGGALRFRVQNQLVVVLKNQDNWGDAQRYSDQNDEILPRIEDPALQARHWLNRFSVYYDLGRRPYALDLCERANRLAKANNLPLEEAATANNLGIAYVYFDRPGDAVRVLSEGIAAARDSDIVAGHNYLNRGLVRMVEWQLRGGTALARAEEDIAEASRRFQATGYTQGILYGNASLGLIRMYEALKLKASFTATPAAEWPSAADYPACIRKFHEARGLMELGLDMARQKGEDWPDYGIQGDLALWNLWHPTPDPEQALAFATGAYELVDGKKDDEGHDRDPEGKSILAMVLARVLLDRKEDPGRVWELLERAERVFTDLGFHSAAARAAAGMIEVAPLLNKEPDGAMALRETHRGPLDASWFPGDYAEKFEPMDWKLLFLHELF